jgi:hypothetical protein
MNPLLYNNISRYDITFLKDVNKSINFSLKREFKYRTIGRPDSKDISDFILSLEPNYVFTVIPIVSATCIVNDPKLVLSRQILLTNCSNNSIVEHFLFCRLELSQQQFGFDLDKLNT